MKKVFILILGVIVVVVLVLALYSNTNKNSDNAEQLKTLENEQDLTLGQEQNDTLENESEGDTPSDISPQPTKLITQEPTILERKLIVFIDKNNDGLKDSNEVACTLCSGQSLLFGEKYSGSLLPITAKINTASIDIKGTIKESALGTANIGWGVYSSKNIIIPTSDIAFGDGTLDKQIPAYEYIAKIAGVNANIVQVEDIGSDTEYHFKTLIPILKTNLENSKKLYVKYSLNPEESKYYIAEGAIKKDIEDYIITVNWNVQSSIKQGYLNAANITFFTL